MIHYTLWGATTSRTHHQHRTSAPEVQLAMRHTASILMPTPRISPGRLPRSVTVRIASFLWGPSPQAVPERHPRVAPLLGTLSKWLPRLQFFSLRVGHELPFAIWHLCLLSHPWPRIRPTSPVVGTQLANHIPAETASVGAVVRPAVPGPPVWILTRASISRRVCANPSSRTFMESENSFPRNRKTNMRSVGNSMHMLTSYKCRPRVHSFHPRIR